MKRNATAMTIGLRLRDEIEGIRHEAMDTEIGKGVRTIAMRKRRNRNTVVEGQVCDLLPRESIILVG